ncbi:UDP-N-acetylmuramoyl-L-alanine--D-glutamate ligase [Helicobacter sp. 23-1044]
MDNRVIKQSTRAFEFENPLDFWEIRVDKILAFYRDFRRVNLLGYGKIMRSLSKFLAQRGVLCDIYDDKFEKISHDSFGNRLLPSGEIANLSPNERESTLSIISPGIPPFHALAKNAPNLISEYDFFAPTMPKSVWISGTNGKTTTTQMCALLLRDFGAQSGGNIGTPLCEMDCNAPLWALETSSFMLHYTNLSKPDIYALLPIAPDHISWHGDFESYVASKLKPLTMMGADSSAIIPQIYAKSPQAKAFKGKLYLYDSAESLANLFGIEANRVHFKGAFLLDSILSLAILSLFTGKIDYDLMNSFKIDAHKVEEFLDAKGRVFVDDSKATNISAALEALKIYADKFIFLILGGDNKGVSLAPLAKTLQRYRTKVFAIGACENHIKELCDESCLKCEVCGDLQNAVAKIKREFNDTQNQICLLSPACASLDQFKSYADRGDKFKEFALE